METRVAIEMMTEELQYHKENIEHDMKDESPSAHLYYSALQSDLTVIDNELDRRSNL